jgi:hypothetical protein
MLFLFSSSSGYAQVGIKAGIGVSDIIFKTHGQSSYLSFDNKGVTHNLPKLSYQLGLFKAIRLSDKWNVQLELLYINYGIDYSTDYLYDDISYKIDIHYLQLPVLVKYQITQGNKSATSLFLGPYTARKLKATKTIEVQNNLQKEEVKNVNSFDYGGILGIGYDRVFSFGKIQFDFSIGFSLSNMMKPLGNYPLDYSFTPDDFARNAAIIFSIGYLFNERLLKSKTQ